MSKKKIGVFGGSFDPIHFGHLNLALELLEIHRLDQVLFIPAYCSPFKRNKPPEAKPEDRVAMLELAIEKIPQFEISTIEIERQGPSFTVETLRALHSEQANLHLLLSEDALPRFKEWKEASEILKLAPPLIGSRGKVPPHSGLPRKCFTLTRIMEISSTDVRERLKNKLYCGHLVPAKTLDYIHKHRLYSTA